MDEMVKCCAEVTAQEDSPIHEDPMGNQDLLSKTFSALTGMIPLAASGQRIAPAATGVSMGPRSCDRGKEALYSWRNRKLTCFNGARWLATEWHW